MSRACLALELQEGQQSSVLKTAQPDEVIALPQASDQVRASYPPSLVA